MGGVWYGALMPEQFVPMTRLVPTLRWSLSELVATLR
jgi:hypothetical protein